MKEDVEAYSAEMVGQRIQQLRTALKLNQTEFAERAKLNRSSVALWELGRQRPGIPPAQRICDVYGVTLDWIFLGRRHTLRHEIVELISDSAA